MLRTTGIAALLALGLAGAAGPASALQAAVTQIEKNGDGSTTYHFSIVTDPGETLAPGESKAAADFVTVYNFYGFVEGSAKSRRAGSSRPSSSAAPPC